MIIFVFWLPKPKLNFACQLMVFGFETCTRTWLEQQNHGCLTSHLKSASLISASVASLDGHTLFHKSREFSADSTWFRRFICENSASYARAHSRQDNFSLFLLAEVKWDHGLGWVYLERFRPCPTIRTIVGWKFLLWLWKIPCLVATLLEKYFLCRQLCGTGASRLIRKSNSK